MPRRMIYATPVLCFDFNKQGVCHERRRGDAAARLMHAWYFLDLKASVVRVVYLLAGLVGTFRDRSDRNVPPEIVSTRELAEILQRECNVQRS